MRSNSRPASPSSSLERDLDLLVDVAVGDAARGADDAVGATGQRARQPPGEADRDRERDAEQDERERACRAGVIADLGDRGVGELLVDLVERREGGLGAVPGLVAVAVLDQGERLAGLARVGHAPAARRTPSCTAPRRATKAVERRWSSAPVIELGRVVADQLRRSRRGPPGGCPRCPCARRRRGRPCSGPGRGGTCRSGSSARRRCARTAASSGRRRPCPRSSRWCCAQRCSRAAPSARAPPRTRRTACT